ncbi:MAG: aspartate kinase [Clostridia bacterium]|jgi:aspartate kinase|nr:aspartate kinase [Clostridia bacterium]MBT7122820.1 aspartate kinase [Clostridia bacterium]
MKVCKFGGSSLANAEQIKKIKQIVELDSERKYVVPSAPGKRTNDDIKVTDLLIAFHSAVTNGEDYTAIYSDLSERYVQIRDGLGLDTDIETHLANVKADVLNSAGYDYTISRGEFLNGLLIADYLGYDFIDAADVIFFDSDGEYKSEKTRTVLRGRLSHSKTAVVPGFYGSMPNGKVKTFSRGGTDITGAIVARAARAEVYENWTDVSGFLMADPRIVDNPQPIKKLSYRELRELAYMGATVLHEDAIFPVFKANIPINIKNTNQPDDEGTFILPKVDNNDGHIITGIAGRKGFSVLAIEKTKMNAEIGFGRKVLSALENNGMSFEHMPSGVDTLSIVLANSEIEGKQPQLLDDVYNQCEPDSLEVFKGLALIATVGRGMIHNIGVAARLFAALAKSGVNIRMIDQGSSEINIIVGIDEEDFEVAIKAIYSEFCS